MTTGVFVDSTTLLYTADLRDQSKQARSKAWLKRLLATNLLLVSPRSLNETYAVVRRKPEFAHWRPSIRQFIEDLFPWATLPLTVHDLTEAWRIEDRYGIGFWDSLQITSANSARCAYFLSEDLNDGQTYGAVTVLNPFRHRPEDVLGAAARP